MQLSTTIAAGEFRRSIEAYMTHVRVMPQQAIRFQGRLLLQKIEEFTPPKTRKQGRLAVARDVRRSILLLRPQDFDNPEIKALIRARDYDALTAILGSPSWGFGRGLTASPFTPEMHESQRNRRGVVTLKTPASATPDVSDVKAYIRELQDRVGQARGAWTPGIIGLGGVVANWTGRWSSKGTFTDRTSSDVAPYIEAVNRSAWASGGDDDRILENAFRSRSQQIMADVIRRLDEAAKRARLDAN